MPTTRDLMLPFLGILLASDLAAAAPSHAPRYAPSTSESLGCYHEPPSHEGRALKGDSHHSEDMTIEQCATFCNKFKYYGLEYGKECWCGNSVATNAAPANGECTMSCAGDSSENCGDGDRLNLFLNTAYIDPTVATVQGYTYRGCHTESPNGRALPAKVYSEDNMTPQLCADRCSADSYLYAGLEWGRECWCDNTLHGGQWVDDSQCLMLCTGDANSFCGEGQRLTVYGPETVAPKEDVTGWNYVGCAADDKSARVLSADRLDANDMTPDKCAAFCSDYTYAGVQFGTECYCGNSFTEATVDPEECTSTCGGDGTLICGDADRLTVYASATTASHVNTVGDFAFLQCGVDSVDDRVLSDARSGGPDMTAEKCAATCEGYSFFGLEFGKECFCGNAYDGVEAPVEECHMRCAGDSSELCGARDRISVYATQLIQITPEPGFNDNNNQPPAF